MAKTTQLVLLCLALFVAISVAKCPAGKKVSFETAACFMSKNGATRVALSTLFTDIGKNTVADDISVEKYECQDISRRKCERITTNVNFYAEQQEIEIHTEACSGDYSSSPKCTVFYDVYHSCGKKPSKATVMVPSTEEAIFHEAAGCNFFPEDKSTDACPVITINVQHTTLLTTAASGGAVLAGATVKYTDGTVNVLNATLEQQKKLQNAYLRYYVDNSGSCDYETSYLQLPVTSVYTNFAKIAKNCKATGTNLVVELVYQCKEHTFTSPKYSIPIKDIKFPAV